MYVFSGSSDVTAVSDGPDKVRKSVSVDATPSVDEPEPGRSAKTKKKFHSSWLPVLILTVILFVSKIQNLLKETKLLPRMLRMQSVW